ncbi:MAG: aminotransferase class I/II-fold pyridoxal phosphate-dependent enzyme [Bacteroidales bacterium]|nr:aminotransferase class I/II-fold pyridoxal phosphate-dependent enzyme [Bacteroidales bacterium]
MKNKKFETRAIRTQAIQSSYKEHSVPIYETSSFVFNTAEEAEAVFAEKKSGYLYSRYNNPNTDELVSKLCLLENAESGVATSSGMAAVFLSMGGILRAGDHIILSRHLFATTHLLVEQVLSKWGITHSYVKMNNPEKIVTCLLPSTRMIFVETPSNPGLEIFDLELIGKFSKQHDLYFVVDNCFATPYLQNPMKYGADFVIHSTTKFIDGQGRTIGGAILGKEKFMNDIITLSRMVGTTMAPTTGWLLSKSLETLSIRMERLCSNALSMAEYLENHPDIEWVKYPFLSSHPNYKLARKQMRLGGALVTFELKGGRPRAMKFINALKLFSITPNLGDTRTTITHPATTTHSKLSDEERTEAGITDGMMRVSVGLEHIDDLIEDLENAISYSKKD